MTDPITDRIPKPKNVGKHRESTVYSLWNNLKITREIASSPEPSLYIPSERHACGYPLPNRRFHSTKFPCVEISVYDEQEIRELYNMLNFGGIKHEESERA